MCLHVWLLVQVKMQNAFSLWEVHLTNITKSSSINPAGASNLTPYKCRRGVTRTVGAAPGFMRLHSKKLGVGQQGWLTQWVRGSTKYQGPMSEPTPSFLPLLSEYQGRLQTLPHPHTNNEAQWGRGELMPQWSLLGGGESSFPEALPPPNFLSLWKLHWSARGVSHGHAETNHCKRKGSQCHLHTGTAPELWKQNSNSQQQ